jgi:hypothetical protein
MYNCEKCNYETHDKTKWERHILTKKHNSINQRMELEKQKLEQKQLNETRKLKLQEDKLQLEKEKLEQKKKKDEEERKLQEEKLEQKKKKDEELIRLKEMKELAKIHKESEKTKIINWDDFCYDTIKSDISFNFKQTILNKKDNFFEELLIAILDNPRFRCMRVIDNELQIFNETWETHMFGQVDDEDLRYDMEYVLEKLKEIGSEFNDRLKYKHHYGLACNGSITTNIRLKTLKQIIKNKDLGFDFYYEKMKEEQEKRTNKILEEREKENKELEMKKLIFEELF